MKSYILRVFALFECLGLASCGYFSPLSGESPVANEFLKHADSRIYYKPGMEEEADKIEELLQGSINKVEEVHKKEFTKSVVVHICDTPTCFSKYTDSNERIKAAVNVNGLFLSPLAFERNRHEKFLIHELSHLHLFQQISIFKAVYIPQWFHEGLAVYVSSGGGADLVSYNDAIEFINERKHFLPVESGGLFGDGGAWGDRWPQNYKKLKNGALQQHVNYRQSAIFFQYLNKTGKAIEILRLLEKGKGFNESFRKIYGESVSSEWATFLGSVALTSKASRTPQSAPLL